MAGYPDSKLQLLACLFPRFYYSFAVSHVAAHTKSHVLLSFWQNIASSCHVFVFGTLLARDSALAFGKCINMMSINS
jgi:hypothetical protein